MLFAPDGVCGGDADEDGGAAEESVEACNDVVASVFEHVLVALRLRVWLNVEER